MANIGQILNDPDFGKFGASDKQMIVDRALKADADFGKLSTDDQLSARNSIYKTAGIPTSKYPKVTTPGEALEGAVNAMAPHSPAEAGIMAATSLLPFGEEAAEGVPVLGAIAKKGLTGALARTGLTTAVGGALGGKEGAEEGLLTGAGGETLGKVGGAITGANKIENQMVSAAAPAVADEAAQGAIERRLGMTAPEAKTLATPKPGPSDAASLLAEGKRVVSGGRTAARREVGKLYDPIYDPIKDQPVNPEGLSKIAKGARESAGILTSRGFGPGDQTKPTRDLLDEFGRLDEDTSKTDINKILSGKGAKGGKLTLSNADIAKIEAAQEGKQTGPITIGQLRGRLQQLEQAGARPGISENERAALARASLPIRETLEGAIPDEQKPVLKSINDAYAAVSKAFPYQDLKPLRSASTLPELGEAFSKLKPDATAMVLDHASPEGKELMRHALASYLLNDSTSQKDILNTLTKWQRSGLLTQAGFPDDFQKIGNWRALIGSVRKIRDKPPDLPQTREFMNGVRESLRNQGLSPSLLDKMDDELQRQNQKGDMRTNFLKRQLTLWGPMGAMAGYGWMYRKPEIIVPMAAYMARQMAIQNPAYRAFVMNGWTRKGGAAFARLMSAGMVDAAKQYAVTSGWIRPDKEREAEEARP